MNVLHLVDRLGLALDRIAKARGLGSRDAAAAHLLILGLELEAAVGDPDVARLIAAERTELGRHTTR